MGNTKERKTEYSSNTFFNSVIWNAMEKIGIQVVNFVVSVILARIIEPSDYGKFALVSVVNSILIIVCELGLSEALIQKKDITDEDYSTVLLVYIIVCSLTYAGIFIFSKNIAVFFKDPSLYIYIRIYSFQIVISAFKNIQSAYICKNLLFKTYFFSSLFGTFLGAVIGIYMAINGYGIMALIVLNLADYVLDTVITFIIIKWFPCFRFNFDSFKKLFNFGWKLLVTGFLNTLYNNLRELIIGKKYSTSDLAFYDKGGSISNKITNIVSTSIQSVGLPVMSSYQDNVKEVKKITINTCKTMMYILTPMLVGFIAISDNFVRVLLTEKWIDIVPYIKIICISNLISLINSCNSNSIKAMGGSQYLLKIELITKFIDIIMIIILVKYGVLWIALGVIASQLISLFIISFYTRKLIELSLTEQLKGLLPTIIMALIMYILVILIDKLQINIIIKLVLQILSGIVSYVLISVFTKNKEFELLVKLIHNNFSR